MKRYIFLIILVFVLIKTNYSQQGLTLYYMDRTLQSQWINPAIKPTYNLYIAGTVMPILGQVPPPMYLNYANNSFYYNHLFHMGSGLKSDNLILNIPKFMESLRKTTHIRFDTQLELINFGIRVDNYFFSFAVTEKLKYGISLPFDFFELVVNGNKPYMLENKTFDFSRFNLNLTHYREFAFGVSTSPINGLNIGARAKILFGQANLNTDFKSLSLYTNPATYYLTLTSDIAIRSSMPFYFDYEVFNDSINFDINQSSIDNITPGNYLFNMRNAGLAFDVGASYRLNSEIDLFFSATDVGFIKWKTNTQSFISNGEFTFKGFEVNITDDDVDTFEELADSIFDIFRFRLQENYYSTWLPSSVYIGGVYKYHEKLHFGALLRTEFYQKTVLPSLTISVNSNLTNWFSAHASYSYAHNYFGNVGLGITAKLGFVSWYIVTDNITGMIFPQKLKNFNLRMGCNLVFGKPIDSIPLLK